MRRFISTPVVVPSGPAGITDYDGNVYTPITIGTQTWLKENMKATKSRDGSNVSYKWYNDNIANKNYGALYLWNVASATTSSTIICPTGYHVPSTTEWNTLVTYIGGLTVGGGKLKATGTTYWTSPNTSAADTYGFFAVGAGIVHSVTGHVQQNQYVHHWCKNSATEYVCAYNSANISTNGQSPAFYMSIRCIKD